MTEVWRLSNSEMKQLRRCKRKWWLGTYRRLKPRTDPMPGTALSVGDLVHDSLAAYYDPGRRLDPVSYAESIAAAEALLFPSYGDAIEKELDLVRKMLSGYVDWLEESGADQDLEVLGTEMTVRVPLIDGVDLVSKLDAPVFRRSDGARLALEHKTTGTLRGLAELKIDPQLLTEHLARFMHARVNGLTEDEAHADCGGVIYNMLRKVKRTAAAKPPFYGRIDVTHNSIELRRHWEHCIAAAREMLALRARLDGGEDHHSVCPPNATRDCSWDCSFYRVCAMMNDGSNYESALADLYEERDPLERYDGSEEL